MSRISKVYVFVACLVMLVSCMPEKTELWINKDGSGKMVTSINFGESAGQLQSMMSALDTTKASGDMNAFNKEMDSIMYLSDILHDTIKEKLSNLELAEKAYFHMIQGEGDFHMNIGVEYDNEDELKGIVQLFSEIGEAQDGAGDENVDIGTLFSQYHSDKKNGIFRLEAMDLSTYDDDPEMSEVLVQFDSLLILKDQMDTLSEEKKQEFQFMFSMFESMFLKETTTIIHLPGKVEFSNRPDAIVAGKSISHKTNLYKMLKNKSKNKEWIIKDKQ